MLEGQHIDITPEFSQAFDVLENTQENLFITGKAGTGKSTFLQYFRKNTKKRVVVLAPTGVAALNVRGQTIHSFFRFKPRFLDKDSIALKGRKKLYKNIDVLIIDEISMVRADIFEGIETFLRFNGPEPGKPFGGVQICVIGDLYQLPPVVTGEEAEIFYQFYDSPFFFNTESFEEADFTLIELEKIFRQSELDFIAFLNKVRMGDVDQSVLEFINQRSHKIPLEGSHITLTATNRVADHINRSKLASLPSNAYSYEGEVRGEFAGKARLPAPENLVLKEGAQVMFLKNDKDRRWVNGTIGRVERLTDDEVEVYVPEYGQSFMVGREKWENIKYGYNDKTKKINEDVIGSYKQYPLMLAWAITIHKSQGKTLESVLIDLGDGAFAAGQVYVALSRCKTFDNIYLKQKITHRDIQCDERVIAFTNSCF